MFQEDQVRRHRRSRRASRFRAGSASADALNFNLPPSTRSSVPNSGPPPPPRTPSSKPEAPLNLLAASPSSHRWLSRRLHAGLARLVPDRAAADGLLTAKHPARQRRPRRRHRRLRKEQLRQLRPRKSTLRAPTTPAASLLATLAPVRKVFSVVSVASLVPRPRDVDAGESRLGSAYAAPVTSNLAVAREVAKQVYMAERLAPPTSTAEIRAAYSSIAQQASSLAWWRSALENGTWKTVGIYALEAYGIFWCAAA